MRPLTALVVDDDIGLAQAFSIAMRRSGFEVTTITNSTLALAEIEKVRPDVVILDVNMPIVSGIDILQAVRQNPVLAGMKVIMATASGTISQDDEVQQLADLILLKPIRLTQIITFATRLAEQHRDQETISELAENSPHD
jgi:DNA-binding NtrC family response regulator